MKEDTAAEKCLTAFARNIEGDSYIADIRCGSKSYQDENIILVLVFQMLQVNERMLSTNCSQPCRTKEKRDLYVSESSPFPERESVILHNKQ